MSRCPIAISLLIVMAIVAPTNGAEGGAPSCLSLGIVIGKDKSGNPTIDYSGKFQVLFTNHLKEPIRLWSERCEPGYATLSFRVESVGGSATIMRKRTLDGSAWRNKPPRTITVRPGESLRWDVAPAAFFWGERQWIVPEPNTGTPSTLTAIFEIKPTEQATQRGVWTGRITSMSVKTVLVDAELRTPHDYLEAGFPEQAIRIMQADRTWIGKQDNMQQTPLHVAARYGFVEVVRWLLSNGADVNAQCYNRMTPLHLAKDPEVVRLLVAHKADMNAHDVCGTALQEAAGDFAHLGQSSQFAGDRDRARAIAKILLDAGAEYDIVSACCLGDLERVRMLTADKRQARSPEAMRKAATYGRSAIVKLLLERGADPEDAQYGNLPLSYFAIKNPEVLKLLLDAGADPKVRVEYHGNGMGPQGTDLLHEAAATGIVESAKLLVARGVNVDVRDLRGATPLDAACFGGHVEMVDWLLRNKANLNAHSDHGRTLMSEAASGVRPDKDEDNARYQAIIRRLERAGVELDVFAAIACNDVPRVAHILRGNVQAGAQRTRAGLPAIHLAVILDRREIVKLLLDAGCDPNFRSQSESIGYKGETPLSQAACWGRFEIAEVLIKHNADVNARAERGVAPLHEAAYAEQLEVAHLLLEHGAEVNARDQQGHTPLSWRDDRAASAEMIELLRRYGGVK